ncbi:hypothetical protein Plhal703r1_c01g0001301 [Plasmopara halstedii]
MNVSNFLIYIFLTATLNFAKIVSNAGSTNFRGHVPKFALIAPIFLKWRCGDFKDP